MTPDILNREPIARKVKRRVGERASEIRNRPGSRVRERAPEYENRNFGGGKFVGALGAGIATILEDTIGLPFGATVDITDVDPGENGDIYTINVNAPSKNIAESRAFIDSTTGFTSYLTDKFDIQEVEVLNHRVARDTYQIKLRVVR